MRLAILHALPLLLLTPGLVAQTASVRYFGSECGVSGKIQVQALPKLNTKIRVSTTAQTAAGSRGVVQWGGAPLLLLGVQTFQPGQVLISKGFNTKNSLPPVCSLLVAPLAILDTPLTVTWRNGPEWTGNYGSHIDFQIPNDSGLLGAKVTGQWILHTWKNERSSYSALVNYDYFVTTNAATMTVGR